MHNYSIPQIFKKVEILARYEYILLALFKALPITKCITLSYIPIISTLYFKN